jgi:hypothetical protein
MNRILILITIILIPAICMTQTLTFGKAVQQLYYNVNIKSTSIDTIIKEFNNVANEYNVSKGMYSLSVNLDMNTSGNAKKVSHVFTFIKSPLPDMSVDTGYIKIGIGEDGNIKKILDIDWCFQFLNKTDAEIFFEELKKLFTPLSTKQKFGDDELNLGQYAEFSTRKENVDGIRDVTFFLGKSVATNKYEVRFIPHNEFVE